jgi:hypothetical protein
VFLSAFESFCKTFRNRDLITFSIRCNDFKDMSIYLESMSPNLKQWHISWKIWFNEFAHAATAWIRCPILLIQSLLWILLKGMTNEKKLIWKKQISQSNYTTKVLKWNIKSGLMSEQNEQVLISFISKGILYLKWFYNPDFNCFIRWLT